jgi:TonB family protein
MSNQLLAPPEIDTDDRKVWTPPPLLIRNEAGETFWHSLAGNLRDAMFPRREPPLQLESQAVAVDDPWGNLRNRRPHYISIAVHAIAIAAIVAFLLWPRKPVEVAKQPPKAAFDVTPFLPLQASPATTGGGGGGGSHDVVPARVGKLPKIAKTQFVPPEEIIRNPKPKLVVEPTVVMPKNIQLPHNTMPNLGDPLTAVKGPASNGVGNGGGIGSGQHGGVGSGGGAGVGPGSNGGYGSGLYRVGGGVSPPKLIYQVDPQFSDQARMAKYQGICVVEVIVDMKGIPRNARVIRHLGMGLDEKAIEAVKQYRFKPAMLHGKPVPVIADIEVDFHIY